MSRLNAARNKQELKEAAAKAWNSISNEERNSLVKSMGCRLDAVIGYVTKCEMLFT